MTTTQAQGRGLATPVRVRDQVRDTLAVAGFTAAASGAAALALFLLTSWAR